MATAILWGIGAVSLFAPAAAQVATTPSASAKLIVLRSNGADASAISDRIDAALLRDLTSVAGMDQPQVSPMEYEEIQLNAGCSDQSRSCLAAIAGMAQADGLIVRSLAKTGATFVLDLVYFDAASHDEPAHASITGDDQELVASMPSLVRRLFGMPDAVAPAVTSAPVSSAPIATQPQPAQATRSRGGSGLIIASIVTLAVGAGVGLGGIVVGSSASASFEDYKNTDVTDPNSAAAADAAFADADSQATLANILMPIGGALLVGGAVMLVIGLSSGDDATETTQVAIAPTPDGGVFVLSGAL